jgi:cellulase/cellobiase CelA1
MSGALRHAAKEPVLITVVIYDLPNRDCAALASNCELTSATSGCSHTSRTTSTPSPGY